jgi:hypothetical protein
LNESPENNVQFFQEIPIYGQFSETYLPLNPDMACLPRLTRLRYHYHSLYLAGEFGVMLNPDRLVPQKSEGRFECYEENLLPYYAGVIEYVSEFTLQCLPETDAALLDFVYAEPFYEAVEVSINGGDYAPILWQPHRLKLATQQLRVGKNRLTTRVYTTLIRSFEGQCFDYHRHVYRDIENTARDSLPSNY